MKTENVKLSAVKRNPNNPRVIKDDKFAKLVTSIREFPKMMEIRPIVVNNDMIVLGGNMRLAACKELGIKEVPIVRASDLTEEEQRRFIIADNVGFGEWDWELLANEWEAADLVDWGLDVWGPTNEEQEEQDYSDKNKEIDVEALDEKMTIVLSYNFEEYEKVREALARMAHTPEQAIWKLLRLDNE